MGGVVVEVEAEGGITGVGKGVGLVGWGTLCKTCHGGWRKWLGKGGGACALVGAKRGGAAEEGGMVLAGGS